MTRQIRAQGISALLVASLLFALAAWCIPHSTRYWSSLMVGLAALEAVCVFIALTWSLQRSNSIFMSVFGGGFLLRVVGLGAAAWLLLQHSAPVAVPLLTLVGVSFVLSLLQIPFLVRLNPWTSSKS